MQNEYTKATSLVQQAPRVSNNTLHNIKPLDWNQKSSVDY